jgi:CheY-like chemotaxis protein
MMMPVMDGRKAIDAMLKIRPDLQFIAITGLMQPGEIAQGAHATQIEVLRKPFTPVKILETLARVAV